MEVADMLEDIDDCRFATVAMFDTVGTLRGQMVSRQSLDSILVNGMGMAPVTLALDPTDEILDMPGVTDESADFHDAQLRVDHSSARRIPWHSKGHDLLVLSEYSGDTAALCPRSILRNAIKRCAEANLVPRYGIELEYTLFNETPASAQSKNYRNLEPATTHASHDLVLYQTMQSEWYESVSTMCESLRIDLAKMHEEIGPGFMEACVSAGEGVEVADQAALLKNFLRALALRNNKLVTFMPRWSEQADSQSSHIHMSMKNASGDRVFFDDSAAHQMSDICRHFVGGLQRHMGELMLMSAPTVNSYRRFAPGTFAPPGLTWGFENRTAAFRTVGHDAGSVRVENRLPGSDANPYLSVAATLAAGMAGIEGAIEPADEVLGNGYAREPQDGEDFPPTLTDAIAAFRGSSLARNWFGDTFVEAFAATRESQEMAFRFKVPDTELVRFFELG
jgi:glutamine synthetase